MDLLTYVIRMTKWPGDLPHPGIEPRSPALQAASLPSEHQGSPRPPRGFLKSYFKLNNVLHVLGDSVLFINKEYFCIIDNLPSYTIFLKASK